MEEQENYPLDEALINMLGEIAKAQEQLDRQMAQVAKAQEQLSREAIALPAQRNGALVLFIRQHNLPGNWTVAENGRELVRARDPQPVAEQKP